jgi:hypothetical protein
MKCAEAVSEIYGKEMHVNPGSVLRLRCTVRNLVEKPGFIFWYHAKKDGTGEPELINYAPRVKTSIVDGEVLEPTNQTISSTSSVLAQGENFKVHGSDKSSAEHQQVRHEQRRKNQQQGATGSSRGSSSSKLYDLFGAGGGDKKAFASAGSVGLTVTGLLTIERVSVGDSGNFTCSPQHAAPSTISVHILSEGTCIIMSLLSFCTQHKKYFTCLKASVLKVNSSLWHVYPTKRTKEANCLPKLIYVKALI